MYRAKKIRETKKYLALTGLMLIFLGFAGLVLVRFSYVTEVKVIEVGPITASIKERDSTENTDVAALGAIAAGALLTYFGRKAA